MFVDSCIISVLAKLSHFALTIVLIGGIVIGFGLVFIAQSNNILGPPSSFMYNNPEWTINGSAVIAIGVILCSIGVLWWFVRGHRNRK